VADTVEGTIKAATVPEAAGLVFNIGSDREISVNQLAQLVRELTRSRSEITHVPYTSVFDSHFEETRRRVPDTSRAREILKFEAQTTLEEGLQRTLEWFQD
jgi:UDP-glucose 4-epimerase